MDMNIAVIAGHLAFGLIAFSFLVKDILWLRIVSIIASLFSVFYNYVIPVEPMWIPIGWNFVFCILNLLYMKSDRCRCPPSIRSCTIQCSRT